MSFFLLISHGLITSKVYAAKHVRSWVSSTDATISTPTAEVCFSYVTLVRPHLNYAAPVWDPHLQRDIRLLEDVQKFGLRVCSKQWDMGYQELLDMFSLPSLENRRLYLKLCHLFKIIHGLCFFPPETVIPNFNLTHSSRSFLLQQLLSQTNSFYHSFIPDSVRCGTTYLKIL